MEQIREQLRQLMILAKSCRRLQKKYFAHRNPNDLESARKVERDLDAYLEKLTKNQEQPKWF